MVKYKILIDGVDYTSSCALPFKEQYVLDSALDNGVLNLFMIPRKEVFKPFTLITITKDNDTYNMFVASDKVTEIVGTGKYNHDLVLIEETKLLEKKVVDTNTTTQPLVHEYLTNITGVLVTGFAVNLYNVYYKSNLFNPVYDTTSIAFPTLREWKDQSNTFSQYLYWTVLGDFSGYIKIFKSEDLSTPIYTYEVTNKTQSFSGWDTAITPTLETDTSYIIEYYFTGLTIGGGIMSSITDTFVFATFTEKPSRRYKSITDVVNRLLAITETLRASETPALVFNQEQADFYNQAKETWLLNDSVDTSTEIDVNIDFISNGITYTNIATRLANLYYDNSSVYFEGGDIWANNAYKTITFQERPTGTLLTWLQANGTKQDEELLYPAPEFAMTKSTLRECLDQVGSYIHSIVRLVGNTIYFDKLGGTTETTLDKDYIGHYETLDAEQYASQLDSIVSNLTNIDDEATGTIIEPFRNAYKTVRAESGTITINDTSAIIETDYPIEKIAKLECGYITVGGINYLVGDITPYVYEKAEYDLLSSNSGTYPLSKGYAITYTQGQPNITGLTFKLPNSVSPIFSKPAILNIISQKLGINVQTIFNVQDITELQFRLTYYPSTTARVKQSRTDINNYSMELTSIYNQSANKVDSRAYGENLKGAIARLGNIEKFITYELSSPDDLQNVGDYVIIDNEDYYIATISVENQIDHIKVTVGLSKDFNALSKYIGIKNNIRLYEVSEKQSVERHINYEDYCVIGNAITSDNKQLITGVSVISILGQFTISTASTTSISVARVQGTDIDEVQKEQVDLPVISLGLGNTIWIGFKYADNYSAGNQSVNPPQGDTLYRLNQYVPYADYFGELETLKINMYSTLQSVDSSNAVTVGNALPVSTLNTVSNTLLISTQSDDIVIKKDSREQINFAYQMHYVTNDNIIIGTQLAQGCPLVSNFNETYAELYVLPNRINKFASNIDLTNATLVKSYNNVVTPPDVVFTGNSITFGNQIATASGKSWAMVDKASGKLLFGKNIAVENGEEIEMPTMTFTHKY